MYIRHNICNIAYYYIHIKIHKIRKDLKRHKYKITNLKIIILFTYLCYKNPFFSLMASSLLNLFYKNIGWITLHYQTLIIPENVNKSWTVVLKKSHNSFFEFNHSFKYFLKKPPANISNIPDISCLLLIYIIVSIP